MKLCAPHILANIEYLKSYLSSRAFEKDFKGIAFDTLAVKQLNLKDILDKDEWERFYQGDDGTFTFYVNLVRNTFSHSSISNDIYNIDNRNVDEMFNFLKGGQTVCQERKDKNKLKL